MVIKCHKRAKFLDGFMPAFAQTLTRSSHSQCGRHCLDVYERGTEVLLFGCSNQIRVMRVRKVERMREVWILSVLVLISLGLGFCQNTDGDFLEGFLVKSGVKRGTYHFESPVCSWVGVLCNDDQDRVLNVSIKDFGLRGVIPDNSIGKISTLTALELDGNFITGFASDMWGLANLKHLSLSRNNLTGILANNIGNYGNLRILDLSQNKLSGPLPASLGSLANLKFLNLSHNMFNGSIPNEILSLAAIIDMDLSNNQFSGRIPQVLSGALTELRSLSFARNQIVGVIEDLRVFKVSRLTYLNISSNFFSGHVNVLSELVNLEVADLSENAFTESVSAEIFSMPRIWVLRLARNNLAGELIFVGSSTLRELDLSRNMLEKWMIEGSSNWPDLTLLDISNNRLNGGIPLNLQKFSSLKHMNLAKNKFDAGVFPNITSLDKLEYLNLSSCKINGLVPDDIFMFKKLKVLDLSENHLAGPLPHPAGSEVDSLSYVDFSVNRFNGAIPLDLARQLESMKHFNFSYNNLSLCNFQEFITRFPDAFLGLVTGCPFAVNPESLPSEQHKHRSRLALALGIAFGCLLLGIISVLFVCRRKAKCAVKQMSNREVKNMLGPFSFETDSYVWVADVKLASSIPVVMFEKPLLNLTFADLLTSTDHFNKETLLAEGRYGPVYGAVLLAGFQVVIKVLINQNTLSNEEAAAAFEHLGDIKHPNLVPLLGYCIAGDKRIAIYEFMENGTVHHWLHDLPVGTQATEDWSTDTWEHHQGEYHIDMGMGANTSSSMEWKFRYRIALGTARALAFLHHGCSPPMVHGDVRSSTIYLDSALGSYLADFGLSDMVSGSSSATLSAGSGYAPPEYEVMPMSSSKGDAYSFGVVLLELLTGKKPVNDNYPQSKEGTLVGWARHLVRSDSTAIVTDPKLSDVPSDQIQEVLRIGYLCTADSPAKRPTMQQIVGLLKDMEPRTEK